MNLDWALLRQQKQALLDHTNHNANILPIDIADGLIHLIDYIQDYSVDNGNATEFQVFGVFREICGYQFGEDANGNHSHIDNVPSPIKTGWSLYVREYKEPITDQVEIVYDEDFTCVDDYNRAMSELIQKYPDASIDIY